MKAILIGILGALFFSVTFILNRSMELDGGSWVWSASLRFIFMLLILLIIVGWRRDIQPVWAHLKQHPAAWLVWSTVGFGLFYAPMTFATIYGPGWLVAATFQLTIIAGSLLVPLLNKGSRIPIQAIFISLIILAGVCIIQFEHATTVSLVSVILSVLPLIISAFAYPLGNRKMMQLVGKDLDTFQRILGMTIASMPFWLILSIYGAFAHGGSQVLQTFIVAISSGIIATALFFYATELVHGDDHKLAGVEATQSGEVVFALLWVMFLLSAPLSSFVSIIGMLLVIFGMILHSVVSALGSRKKRHMYEHGDSPPAL